MAGIVGIVLIAIVALIVVSLMAHFLFSPWLLAAAAVVAAWAFFRSRRSRR